MNRTELLQKIELSIRKRSPLLAEHLQPGLPVKTIERQLKKISGLTQPLYDLYGWHDGISPYRWQTGETYHFSFALKQLGFFPDEIFFFMGSEKAVAQLGFFNEIAKRRPALKEGVGRYFPLLWDGSTAYFTLDLDPGSKSRVIFFENESEVPFQEAYTTIDDFLIDVLRANETGEKLRFFEEGLKG
jgi:hypothetical protein